jgi:hypothetical protein
MRHPPLITVASAVLHVVGALAAQTPAPTPAPAQAAPPQPTPPPATVPAAPAASDQLRALLQQLRGLDAKAWQERLSQLEQLAVAQEQQAATLREQQKQLEAQAAAADGKAKALRAELKQLDELRKLLQSLPADAPLPQPASSAVPAAAPAAAPPAVPPKAQPQPQKEKDAKEPAKAEPASEKKAEKPPAGPAAAAAANLVTWADVEPIFGERCAGCHDADSRKGGLDLSSFAAARQGGGSGKSIVPGQPDQSRLYRMIAQQERPFMPRDAEPLAQAQVQRIRAWIEHGAVDDAAGARAFLAQQQAAAKAAATAVEADANAPPPMPEKLPAVAVRQPPRAVPLQSLARSPRAPLLALPGCGQVLLFDGALQQLGVLPCAHPRIGALQFSTDGAWLAAACGEAGRSGVAAVYDVRTGEVAATVGKERDVPLAVAAHRGRGLIALGGSSKRAHLFTAAGQELFAGKHDDFVLGLQFAPDGALLAAGDRSGAVILWETDGGRIAQTLRGPKGAVNAVAFDRAGAVVFAAAADGTVRAFCTADGKERWQRNAHQGEALALACGPGDRIATCGSDGRIAVFAADGKQLPVSAPAGDWLYAAAFGDSADVVYAGGARGALQRFDVAQKKLTASTPLLPAQ